MKAKGKVEKGAGRPSDVGRYVLLPLAQAAGAAVAAAVLVLTVVSAACIALRWPARVTLIAFLVTLGVTFSVTTLVLMWSYATRFLFQLERMIGRDMPFGPTHDGVVGEPAGRDPVLTYVHDGGRRHGEILEALDFRWWLQKVYSRRVGTTWRDWKGQTLPSGNRISQDQWSTWCQRLIDAGLATREYDTAPLELRGTLAHAEASFIEYLPPYPSGDA